MMATFLLCCIIGTAHGEELRPAESGSPTVVSPTSHRDLLALFSAEDYDWSTLDKGVPSIILTTLPRDLARVPQITERKRLFFLSLLPLVLIVNDEITRQREEMLKIFDIFDRGEPLQVEQQDLVAAISRDYRVEDDPLVNLVARETLRQRVDIIPASLVLAQAANESAYGTSRFALRGNNIFGQWTLSPGSGMVPRNRPPGETYEVARFPTLYHSVKSYMRNINTHRAYNTFRNRRASLRAEGLPLQGPDLAQGLEKYSVRGAEYVGEIRDIIRLNRLSLLSNVSLRLHQQQGADRPAGKGLLSTGKFSSRLFQKAGG